MNIQERLIWIAALILFGFYAHNKDVENERRDLLVHTYQAEGLIQNAQISDFAQQLNVAKDNAYSKGFEDGKTQAAVALMHGGSLYTYADGYHAAISQFGIANPDGHGLSQDFLLELLLDTLDNNESADETYLDIIDNLVSEKDVLQVD